MTLDNLFAEYQKLPDADFEVLLSAMLREQKDRDSRVRKAAWEKVCEAIAHYTANYGNITVYESRENTEICLCYGQFAFSEYGDIEVGA